MSFLSAKLIQGGISGILLEAKFSSNRDGSRSTIFWRIRGNERKIIGRRERKIKRER